MGQPGLPVITLKEQIYKITNVPISRQKLLCPKYWKGFLKDNDTIPTNISIPKGKDALIITLIGTIETFVDKPINERPNFIEDMSIDDINRLKIKDLKDGDDIDVVALQFEPGNDRDDGKMGMYQYNRYVTGLPQHQIRDMLVKRRDKRKRKDEGMHLIESSKEEEDNSIQQQQLSGELAMSMGLELRKAYVNSLSVLKNGTLISGLDDGHIQMWRRGKLINDIIHRPKKEGGVDHVMTLPSFDEKIETSQIFVTAGSGAINIWKDDDNADINNPIFNIPSYPGTSPASITTGSFEITSNNNINKIKNNK